jgi:hypothetical protein
MQNEDNKVIDTSYSMTRFDVEKQRLFLFNLQFFVRKIKRYF